MYRASGLLKTDKRTDLERGLTKTISSRLSDKLPVISASFDCDYTLIAVVGVTDTLMRMFPPFPIPDFAPNFTAGFEPAYNMSWYDTYKFMGQRLDNTVAMVSNASQMFIAMTNYCHTLHRMAEKSV